MYLEALMLSLLGIPLAFCVILVLVRKKIPYGISVLSGATVIGFFYGFGTHEFLTSITETIEARDTLTLTSIIILIGILGHGFKKTGHINITVEELRKLFGEKMLLASLPAVFGMLPIPGGALMSAPVIEPEAHRLGLSPEEKTYINIWFRHSLFLIFPLSSTLILTASLARTNIYAVIAYLFPLFLIAIAVGYLMGLKSIKTTPTRETGSLLKALYGISPILLVIVLNLFFHIGFALGLCAGILLLFVESGSRVKEMWDIIRVGFSLQMGIAMVGILFFRQVINDSGAIEDIMRLLKGRPVMLLMVGLPFVVSLFCGLAMLSVGVSFPILFPLSPLPPPLFAAILYTSAHTGYLASPLHLCLIVTNEYYGSNLLSVYKKILPSVGVLVFYNICFTLFFILR